MKKIILLISLLAFVNCAALDDLLKAYNELTKKITDNSNQCKITQERIKKEYESTLDKTKACTDFQESIECFKKLDAQKNLDDKQRTIIKDALSENRITITAMCPKINTTLESETKSDAKNDSIKSHQEIINGCPENYYKQNPSDPFITARKLNYCEATPLTSIIQKPYDPRHPFHPSEYQKFMGFYTTDSTTEIVSSMERFDSYTYEKTWEGSMLRRDVYHICLITYKRIENPNKADPCKYYCLEGKKSDICFREIKYP